MLEQILVADDGSEPARQARQLAVDIATATGAHLSLAHALTAGEDPAVWQRHLDETTADIPAAVTTSTVVRQGPRAELLIDLAEEVDADLVAAGTHGLGGVKRFVLGTVSQRLLEGAPCSVLLCRTPVVRVAPTKVLVGVDGSPHSLAALKLAEHVAAALSACLVITHVANYHIPFAGAEPYGQLRAEVRRHGEEVLHEARRPLAAPLEGVIEDLREGWPRDELIAACQEHQPVVAVVGSRGEGRFRGLLLGSTARDLVNDAPCAVLVVRDDLPDGA